MIAAGWLALAAALLLAPVRAAGGPARHRSKRADTARSGALPWVAAAALAVTAVLLGGRVGALLAAPLAVGGAWSVGRRSGSRAADRPPEPRSAAFLLDLLASALAGGAPPELAIDGMTEAVRQHGTDSLRRAAEPLSRVGRLLRLGGDPAAAWASLQAVPGYEPVADCGRRCASSGARLAGALAGVAGELRARRQSEALAKAERVGVWSLLPLGLCFLPAFVCLGVVPVLLGMAGQLLPAVPS